MQNRNARIKIGATTCQMKYRMLMFVCCAPLVGIFMEQIVMISNTVILPIQYLHNEDRSRLPLGHSLHFLVGIG